MNAKLIYRKIIALSNDPLLPENNLILSAPGVQNYDMYLPVNFEGAQFEKAYKIEIAGLSEGTSENRSKITHPNPIKTLNTLSHREDGKILYGRKVFTNETELKKQVRKHENRYNRTAKTSLDFKSPDRVAG